MFEFRVDQRVSRHVFWKDLIVKSRRRHVFSKDCFLEGGMFSLSLNALRMNASLVRACKMLVLLVLDTLLKLCV